MVLLASGHRNLSFLRTDFLEMISHEGNELFQCFSWRFVGGQIGSRDCQSSESYSLRKMWAKIKHVIQIGLKILKGVVVRIVVTIEFFISRVHQTVSRWISSRLQTCFYPLDLEQFYLPPPSLDTPISERSKFSRDETSSDAKDDLERPIVRTRSYSSEPERSHSVKRSEDAKIEILTISRKEARNLVKQGKLGDKTSIITRERSKKVLPSSRQTWHLSFAIWKRERADSGGV